MLHHHLIREEFDLRRRVYFPQKILFFALQGKAKHAKKFFTAFCSKLKLTGIIIVSSRSIRVNLTGKLFFFEAVVAYKYWVCSTFKGTIIFSLKFFENAEYQTRGD